VHLEALQRHTVSGEVLEEAVSGPVHDAGRGLEIVAVGGNRRGGVAEERKGLPGAGGAVSDD
jgi:hypothetical protein